MPIKNLLVLKKHTLLISLAYTFVLLVASLITLDLGKIESFTPSFGDKIFHFFAYSLLTYTWYFTCKCYFNIPKKRVIVSVFIGAIMFGMFIEVLQSVLTESRFFDVYDIAANALGSLLTVVILFFNTKRGVKKY